MGGVVQAISGGVGSLFTEVAKVFNETQQTATAEPTQATQTTGAISDGAGGGTVDTAGSEPKKKLMAGRRAGALTIPLTSSTTTSNTGSVGVGANTGV